jgi:hypothetical protein
MRFLSILFGNNTKNLEPIYTASEVKNNEDFIVSPKQLGDLMIQYLNEGGKISDIENSQFKTYTIRKTESGKIILPRILHLNCVKGMFERGFNFEQNHFIVKDFGHADTLQDKHNNRHIELKNFVCDTSKDRFYYDHFQSSHEWRYYNESLHRLNARTRLLIVGINPHNLSYKKIDDYRSIIKDKLDSKKSLTATAKAMRKLGM